MTNERSKPLVNVVALFAIELFEGDNIQWEIVVRKPTKEKG